MDGVYYKGRGAHKSIAYGWLLLSVFSLVFAGIFALMVAMARTPGVESLLPPGGGYIYVALVGHVILAVVIWFLAFEGFLWVHTSTALMGRPLWSGPLGYAGLIGSASGVLLLVISALFALGPPVLANYVPVLESPVFFAGLLLFAAGVCATLVNTAMTVGRAVRDGVKVPAVVFGMCACGAAVFVALACFAISGATQYLASGSVDFELLFWGGGHILQFANTIAMLSGWLYLSALLFRGAGEGQRWARPLFLAYLLFILPSPFIYLVWGAENPAHKAAFTWLMRWGLGPLTAVFIAAALRHLFRQAGRQWADPGFSSLVLSMAVFIAGALIAIFIRGSNTIVPAHYHCSIGAVTIAFMGLFYKLAPPLGRQIRWPRLAFVQPWLYSLGVFLFSIGLFGAGMLGVARKTYGAGQNLDSFGRIAGMSIMGVGALLAIAGGVTFVWNAVATLLKAGAAGAEARGVFPAVGAGFEGRETKKGV